MNTVQRGILFGHCAPNVLKRIPNNKIKIYKTGIMNSSQYYNGPTANFNQKFKDDDVTTTDNTLKVSGIKGVDVEDICGEKAVVTKRRNMITYGVNDLYDAGMNNSFHALSYVSHNIRGESKTFVMAYNGAENYASYKRKRTANEEKVENGKFEKDQLITVTRGSRDRVKYKAAMEVIPKEEFIWTDFMSLDDRGISEFVKMEEIGRAYSLALTTIVPLDEDDIKIAIQVTECIKVVNKGMKNVDEWSQEEGHKNLVLGEDFMKYTWEIMQSCREEFSKLFNMIVNKSEFSYWSRAWTMQEQHQSQVLVYGEIGDNCRFKIIIRSSDIKEHLIKLMKDIRVIEARYDVHHHENAYKHWDFVFRYEHYLCRLLTGEEKKIIKAEYRGQKGSTDQMLLDTIAASPRCAQSRDEFCRAVAIALKLNPAHENVIMSKISKMYLDNRFVPLLSCFSKKSSNSSWFSENTTVKYLQKENNTAEGKLESIWEVNKTKKHYNSSHLLGMQYIGDDHRYLAYENSSGNLVMRGLLGQINIIKFKLQQLKKQNNEYEEFESIFEDFSDESTKSCLLAFAGRAMFPMSEERQTYKISGKITFETSNIEIIDQIIIVNEKSLQKQYNTLLLGKVVYILNTEMNAIVGSFTMSHGTEKKYIELISKATDTQFKYFVIDQFG